MADDDTATADSQGSVKDELSDTAVNFSSRGRSGTVLHAGALASPSNASSPGVRELAIPIIDGPAGETIRRLESSTSVASRKSICLRSTTHSQAMHQSRGRTKGRERRGSQFSEVSNTGIKEMKSQLLAMSTTMKRMRKGGSVLGSLYDMESSENFGLMQPVERSMSVGGEIEDGATDAATIDQMDVGQLRAECEERREKLEQCMAFGQNLMEQMEQLRDEYQELEEEKEQLLEAVAEADTELEDARREMLDIQEEHNKEAQQNRITIDQLRVQKQKVQDLEYRLLTQQEAFKEKEEAWEKEKEDILTKMEEAKEDMQWQEEQVAAAIEFAEKKKPDLEALADICRAFTTKATRKVFFQRLKDWRDDNKKRRHALAILLHNARAWQRWEDDTYNDVWRKFYSWTIANSQRKRHARLELERKEENQRAEMVQSCLRTIIRFVSSAWRVCAFDAMHWWEKTRSYEKDIRKIQAVSKGDGAFLRAINGLQLSESDSRSELVYTAYKTLWTESGTSHGKCFRKWVETNVNVGAEQLKSAQLRSVRDEDVTALSARAEAHERQGTFLRRKCDQLTGEVQHATALARTHEREATRLRDELNRSRQDLDASAEQLLERDRELSRLRSQLQTQLTKSQRRVDRKEDHALAPSLNEALQLAAGLRKHAEETSAALSNRRVVSPRHSPHGSPRRDA
eukprot:Hpha_TRINITY_DN31407_c0_g1::TRINITY_DN31407_c0_g1_i1::g.145355::m.145355